MRPFSAGSRTVIVRVTFSPALPLTLLSCQPTTPLGTETVVVVPVVSVTVVCVVEAVVLVVVSVVSVDLDVESVDCVDVSEVETVVVEDVVTVDVVVEVTTGSTIVIEPAIGRICFVISLPLVSDTLRSVIFTGYVPGLAFSETL